MINQIELLMEDIYGGEQGERWRGKGKDGQTS